MPRQARWEEDREVPASIVGTSAAIGVLALACLLPIVPVLVALGVAPPTGFAAVAGAAAFGAALVGVGTLAAVASDRDTRSLSAPVPMRHIPID